MPALLLVIGGEVSPSAQEVLLSMALKLSDIFAQEQVDVQDAKDAQQRITTLETLSATQQAQIATLTTQNQAATDAGFDPALLQQIKDTADAIHSTLHGNPSADTSGSAPSDTTTPATGDSTSSAAPPPTG